MYCVASSVARGEGWLEPPYWPEEYAIYPVFSTFETDFCTKNENSPPNGTGNENWSRTLRNIDQFEQSWDVYRLYFSEDFFWRSPKFGQKNRLNLSEDRSKCGSRSFDVVSSLQNSTPPTANFWLPACMLHWTQESCICIELGNSLTKL